ncbi:Hypothetical protein D9617_5g070990 [Elsinoe fawcettii]|nr:Hypothetical protein D9617_5g070990 [Elsinoe fawcettii]
MYDISIVLGQTNDYQLSDQQETSDCLLTCIRYASEVTSKSSTTLSPISPVFAANVRRVQKPNRRNSSGSWNQRLRMGEPCLSQVVSLKPLTGSFAYFEVSMGELSAKRVYATSLYLSAEDKECLIANDTTVSVRGFGFDGQLLHKTTSNWHELHAHDDWKIVE